MSATVVLDPRLRSPGRSCHGREDRQWLHLHRGAALEPPGPEPDLQRRAWQHDVSLDRIGARGLSKAEPGRERQHVRPGTATWSPASIEGRRVSRTYPDGRIETMVDRYEGERLQQPERRRRRHNGDLYFTDPPYGLRQPDGTLAARRHPVQRRLSGRGGRRRLTRRGGRLRAAERPGHQQRRPPAVHRRHRPAPCPHLRPGC